MTTTDKILSFLREIDIPYELTRIKGKTFLPALKFNNGVLLIDQEKLIYPGDILHEAGHFAVCEPVFRHLLDSDVYKNGLCIGREAQAMHGEEMAATAWAVAAATYLSLPLETIFHENSYKGANNHLKSIFEGNSGFGYPLLQAWQMTCPNEGYPKMTKWIRELRWIEALPIRE